MEASIFSGLSNFGIIGLIILQSVRWYFDSKKESQSDKVIALIAEVNDLKNKHLDNQKEIKELRQEIVALKEENAIYKGLLLSNTEKAELVKELVFKKKKEKTTSGK